MKRTLLILLFAGIFGGVFAQEATNDNHFLMFLHGGYGLMPNKTGAGLTDSSADYAKKMSNGGAWNAQLFFQHKMMTVGLMYSGLISSGEIETPSVSGVVLVKTSDKILTTYIAPQMGMQIPVAKVFSIGWNAGIGELIYKNNSDVYGKPRIVSGHRIGLNLGVRGIFNITENLGISAEIMSIFSGMNKSNIDYNDNTVPVVYIPKLPVNQFTFAIGLKYSL
jgi:hypothetical protein